MTRSFADGQLQQARADQEEGSGADAPVARLSRSTLQDRVYEELRRAIRAGRFSSGETLTIRGLSDMLGTSSMPVRAAVRRLAQDGTLEPLPNRSMRVPLLSPQRFDELTDVRATLEGHAAALATQRLTTADYAAIRSANDRNGKAVESGDLRAVIAANEEFHFSIYRAARSELLLSMIEQLWQQSGPYLAALVLAQNPATLQKIALVRHLELLAALVGRDAEAARRAISMDITDAAQLYRGSIFLTAGSATPPPPGPAASP